MPAASTTATRRDASSNNSSPPQSIAPPTNDLILAAESQWLFSEQDLLLTPSVVAGLSPSQERENRAKGVNFILQVGIMLKLPQITLASASVFLHRFFMRYPMIEDKVTGRPHQHYYSVAATCLFLATKVEENCRKMKDLVVACVRVAQKQPAKEVDEQDKEFWRWRDTILQLEDLLLEALCFDLSLEPPYKTLYDFLVQFGEENNKPLRNSAWAFVNDSCMTPLCLLWSSRTIAASALYAAARHCKVDFKDDRYGKPWWEVAGVELKSIRKACNYMATVYENTPLRGGNEESMYQRTPEDGDEKAAKTRLLRPDNEIETNTHNGARRGSGASLAGSDISRKRGRMKEEEGEIKGERIKSEGVQEDIPWGGVDRDDRDVKRPRLEPRTNGEAAQHANGLVSPKMEDGSEEGELEQ